MRAAKAASSPNVPLMRPHLGSVAKSAMGDNESRNPSARYSLRAISPKARTRLVSPVAARPSEEHHLEKNGV